MRCPKCHLILAEYHTLCPQCSNDLSELARALGPFYEPRPEAFMGWFSLEEASLEEVPQGVGLEEVDLELPETEDLLLEEESVSLESSPESSPEGDFNTSEAGFEEHLSLDEEIVLEDLSGAEEVPPEEEPEALEAQTLEEIEDIGDIEEIDIEHVLDQETSLSEAEDLEEIPDLEELLPPELQEATAKEKKSN